MNLKGHRFKVIKALKQFNVGNFTILPFDTEHDAAEPLRFFNTIQADRRKAIVCNRYILH